MAVVAEIGSEYDRVRVVGKAGWFGGGGLGTLLGPEGTALRLVLGRPVGPPWVVGWLVWIVPLVEPPPGERG